MKTKNINNRIIAKTTIFFISISTHIASIWIDIQLDTGTRKVGYYAVYSYYERNQWDSRIECPLHNDYWKMEEKDLAQGPIRK